MSGESSATAEQIAPSHAPGAVAEPGGSRPARSQILHVDGLSNRGRYAEEEQRDHHFLHHRYVLHAFGPSHGLRVGGDWLPLDGTTPASTRRSERTDRSAPLLESLVPSIVGRNRLDHKAITPISFARAPALVLIVIAVLSGTPRGIELCECRCIFPEFVWRLQWLPCDDIAGVVQLQANYLKHEAVLSLPPEMTRLADLQHLACSRKFASLTALRSRSWFETARTAWSLDLRVEELL